jgi:hypothetical protein
MSKTILHYVGGGIYQGLPARNLTAADLVEYESVIKELGGVDVITAPGAPYQRAEGKHAARGISVAAEESAE